MLPNLMPFPYSGSLAAGLNYFPQIDTEKLQMCADFFRIMTLFLSYFFPSSKTSKETFKHTSQVWSRMSHMLGGLDRVLVRNRKIGKASSDG